VTSTSSGPTGRTRRPRELVGFVLAAALYAAWTAWVVTGGADRVIGPSFMAPAMSPRSAQGQAAEAFALVTHPYVVLVVTAVLAVRSLQQRQRRLALALGVAAMGIPLWDVQRLMVQRARPESLFSDSVSAAGYGYPAGHMAAATILTWVVVTLANAQRKSPRSQWKRRVLGAFLVGCVGVDQWAMGVHRGPDLVGGVLLGVTVATAALWVSGVEAITRAWRLKELPQRSGRRAAVIYNPTKVLDLDLFHRRVAFAMARSGWDPPVWLETERDDPGRQMARDALAKGVDRVLVAGGDGTARTVCAELAGSRLPIAIIPAGTGNLLGRNLGVPFDEDAALDVALHGEVRAIDLVHWTVDGMETPFMVMAGVGLDAQIMRDTNPALKKVAKAGAYVLAGVQQVRMPPFRATVTVDGQMVHDGDAVMTLVGNVGRLQGGVALIPAAEAGDGFLHVLVAAGGGLRGLVRLLAGIRRDGPSAPLRRVRGTRVEVTLDRPVAYQLDGDTAGEATCFSAEVAPGALLVLVPR
jgi:diacylglycerol kinase family enzyme